MNKYLIEYWFRYGKEEKDFDKIEIDADTEPEAIQAIRDLQSWVFGVKILEVNGIKQ